jgi:uracil-DNA glycosylase
VPFGCGPRIVRVAAPAAFYAAPELWGVRNAAFQPGQAKTNLPALNKLFQSAPYLRAQVAVSLQEALVVVGEECLQLVEQQLVQVGLLRPPCSHGRSTGSNLRAQTRTQPTSRSY